MPAILERLVSQLQDKGHDKDSSFAIATSALQKSGNLKRGSQEPTKKGVIRGKMTPAQRAKGRAAKYSGNRTSNYKYNKRKNIAILK